MSNYNPYPYGTKEYYEKEVELATLQADLVVTAVIDMIKAANPINPDEVVSLCEAVVCANSRIGSAKYALTDYLEKHGNE